MSTGKYHVDSKNENENDNDNLASKHPSHHSVTSLCHVTHHTVSVGQEPHVNTSSNPKRSCKIPVALPTFTLDAYDLKPQRSFQSRSECDFVNDAVEC